ncbi:MAG: S8 family serine peptidase [Chitinispirillales bacterium]|nr:S8 family serine peptidase [Chitinispirillales bacterium]
MKINTKTKTRRGEQRPPAIPAWSYLLIALILSFPIHSTAENRLSPSLRKAAERDTVRNVWVFFNDRPARGDIVTVSERAMQRRQRANFRAGESERRVSPDYIREIERRGGALRHTFAWENAASFSVHSSRLNEIASLPFVKSVSPVAVYIRRNVDSPALGKTTAAASYGGYGWYMDMVNIPLAHEYLRAKKLGEPGSGALMAFFDSGFRTDHHALTRAGDSGSVRYTHDFVDGKTDVHDHDSIVSNRNHRHYQSDRHGTQTLSLVAGYHPGIHMGAAWGANFALARTEDIAIEARIEEDNWAAAVIWADSLGADIISSSLGYRSGFDDPNEDYDSTAMDGKTTIISRAAAGAVARGIIVVNSMGNYGNVRPGTLSAPADVEGVVSVGAVDRNRSLSSFSGVGPTFDGRMKPEVVAPGTGVQTADPYDGHGLNLTNYRNANGTSFSTPIVSGIVALILQANPGISAQEARERLYASCAFAPNQTGGLDSRFGHGIPNALRAVMQNDEIFVNIADSTGKPLTGAVVKAGSNIYTVDETGYLLINNIQPSALPIEIKISFRNNEVKTFTVRSLPFTDNITVDTNRDGGLRVLPSVVRRNNVVRGKYMFSGADISAPAVATVRTLTGKKVWEEQLRLRPDGSAEFIWNCRRGARRVAAGVYFITVRHGHAMISERVVIAD